MEGTVELERLGPEQKNNNGEFADKGKQGPLQRNGGPPQAKQSQGIAKAVVLVTTVILFYFLSYFEFQASQATSLNCDRKSMKTVKGCSIKLTCSGTRATAISFCEKGGCRYLYSARARRCAPGPLPGGPRVTSPCSSAPRSAGSSRLAPS